MVSKTASYKSENGDNPKISDNTRIMWVSDFLDCIYHFNKLWSFDSLFWLLWKVFHNLCRTHDFMFMLFLVTLKKFLCENFTYKNFFIVSVISSDRNKSKTIFQKLILKIKKYINKVKYVKRTI